MTIDDIREAHKALHGSRKVFKQTLIERLEEGWSVEDTINTDNKKGKKVLHRFIQGTKNMNKNS